MPWSVERLTVATQRLETLLGARQPAAPYEPTPLLRDGLLQLTERQRHSIVSWRDGRPSDDGATASAMRRAMSLQMTAWGDSPGEALPLPDANDAEDMFRTAPRLEGFGPLSQQSLPTLFGRQAAGHRHVADGRAIVELAMELGCAFCSASPPQPCHHANLAVNVDQHLLFFSGGTPPAASNGHLQPYDFDAHTWAAIDGHVSKLVDSGAAEALGSTPQPADAFTFANVFLARTYDLRVTESQQQALSSGSALGAAAVATERARTFLEKYVPAARALAGLPAADMAPRLAELWDACLSAISVERKSRLVINLKPSINKLLEAWPFRYASLQSFLQSIRPGGWLAKSDVSAGFHHIRINPAHWKYLCFRTTRGVFRYTRMPFGYSAGPALFSALSAQVNEFMRLKGVRVSMVYIDDFIVYGDTRAECQLALDVLEQLCERLNIKLDPDKTDGPSQRLDVLGLTVDTTTSTVAIPPAKLLRTFWYLYVLRACAREQVAVPVGPLHKAAGSVARLGLVNPCARPYARGFTSRSGTAGKRWWAGGRHDSVLYPHSLELLSRNVGVLVSLVESGELRGENLMRSPSTQPWNVVHLTSDAERRLEPPPARAGASARFGAVAQAYSFSPSLAKALPIGVLELLPLLVFLHRFGDLLGGALLYIATDNMGNAYSLNAASSRSDDVTAVVQQLYDLCRRHSLDAVATWLTRLANHVNDRLATCTTDEEARQWLPLATHSVLPAATLSELLGELERGA